MQTVNINLDLNPTSHKLLSNRNQIEQEEEEEEEEEDESDDENE